MINRHLKFSFAFSLGLAVQPISAESPQNTHHLKHSNHKAMMLHEAGVDIFATVQEVIRQLSANPDTDWTQVNLEDLRQHLRDMHEFSYNVDVVSQQAIDKGVKVRVKPVTKRAEEALKRVLNAHPKMLKMEMNWDMQWRRRKDNSYEITVTTKQADEVAKIRGLGYIGLLAIGNHHQIHHWLMATGRNPHP